MCKCINCHFLNKEVRKDTSTSTLINSYPNSKNDDFYHFAISSVDRARIIEDIPTFLQAKVTRLFAYFIHNNLSCYKGVWDEGIEPGLRATRLETITQTNRKNFCFFFSHRQGMSLPAAEILQEREENRAKNKYDRRIGKASLIIATVALILTLVSNFVIICSHHHIMKKQITNEKLIIEISKQR